MKPGYYLHVNGSLIHKTFLDTQDLTESDLVKEWWYDSDIGQSPITFVEFLKQAKTLGATTEDIFRLANHNRLGKYVHNWQEQVGI